MSFPLGPPPNTPPGSVVLTVSTQSARETYVAVPPAHVEDIFESFAGGRPFFITSTINPSTGKFTKVAINPALIEFIRVEMDAPKENENVRSIQRLRPFEYTPEA